MKQRTLVLIFALMLTTLTTGCMGIFGSRSPEESAMITVVNNLDPPGERTIEIRRSGDDASTLGAVAGGAERTMTYRSRDMQGAYQLVARLPSGAAVVSREFTLFAGAQVRWEMRTNAVSTSQSR